MFALRRATAVQPVQPQRHDQAARGVPVHQHLRGRHLVDDIEGTLELGVVAGQIGGEVRRLAVSPRTAAFVQVKGVEREAEGGKVVGQLGVEEVVGEPVHEQHRMSCGRVGLAAAHQRGEQVALAVGIGAEGERLLPVTRQHVGLPSRHDSHLNRLAVDALAPTGRQ